MFGVLNVVFPKHPRSPIPRSSTTINTMFGFLASTTPEMRSKRPGVNIVVAAETD